MRKKKALLSITILLSLTLLFCQNSQATDQATKLSEQKKQEIIREEWKEGMEKVKPKVSAFQKEEIVQSEIKSPSLIQHEKTVVKEQVVLPSLPDAFYEKLTLRGQDISFKTVMDVISEAVGYNIIYGPEVQGDTRIVVDMKDLEIWRVLNTVLYPLSYGYKIVEEDLIILGVETRSFRIFLPPITQSFSDTTSNESFTASGDDSDSTSQSINVGTKIYVENKIDEISFWKDIEDNVISFLSETGKFVSNKIAGVVTVTDLPGILDKVGVYLNLINTESTKAVEVDIKVVEVTLTDEQVFGIDWNVIGSEVGSFNEINLSSAFGSGNISATDILTLTLKGPKPDSGTSSKGISSVLRALETQGDIEIISQPKLMILNNQNAIIQVGTTSYFLAQTNVETTQSGSTITSVTTGQVQEGVSMRLVANIVGDEVYLNVTPVISTVDSITEKTVGSTKIETPQTSSKSMSTTIKARNGETIVIGGLITEDKRKIREGFPFLSRIPVVGGLFGYKRRYNERKELIIFITPKRV